MEITSQLVLKFKVSVSCQLGFTFICVSFAFILWYAHVKVTKIASESENIKIVT